MLATTTTIYKDFHFQQTFYKVSTNFYIIHWEEKENGKFFLHGESC